MQASSPEPLSSFEVAAPVQVERVCVRFHLDVAPDGDFGWIYQPNLSRARTLRFRASHHSEAP
jgi:hypothetical protein